MVRAATKRAEEQAQRLRERREEIEQTLLTRVYAISGPAEVGDPQYALGLRTVVTAALDYALDCLETSEATRPSLPFELPTQARAAARAGVSLDTVLRRYFAGFTLLNDCLVREAEKGHADLAKAMRAQAELFNPVGGCGYGGLRGGGEVSYPYRRAPSGRSRPAALGWGGPYTRSVASI